MDNIYLLTIKNARALAFLIEDSPLLGWHARDGRLVGQGAALAGLVKLLDAGFTWNVDFCLKKVEPKE